MTFGTADRGIPKPFTHNQTENMSLSLLSESELVRLMCLLREARKVAICAHRNPDGDAVGSALGWAEYLQSINKEVAIVLPNPYPDFLRWLPGSQHIVLFDRHETVARKLLSEADLICCLDFNALSRLGDMGAAIADAKATKMVIDHHLAPDPSAVQFIISHPELCATSELIFRIIDQLGGFENLSRSAATCLYTGMMTDTGAFTYNSSRPAIYAIISRLLTKGIDKDRIYRNVFHNYSENRLRFTGYILSEKTRFYKNHKASIFTVTREEMKRFHFIRGDAEGLVNMPLQVRGMVLSISLREDTDKDVVRVSLRSVDQFPCNKMAEEFFRGGGHLNASGGELPFPLEEAVRTAEQAIEKYSAYF